MAPGHRRATPRKSAELVKRKLSFSPPKTQHRRHLRERSCTSNDSSSSDVISDLDFKQKRVFFWYEDNDTQNDGGEIYSAEWQQRVKEWADIVQKELIRKNRTLDEQVDSYRDRTTKLSHGLLFLAHPISTFALWYLLKACFTLDEIICGTSNENLEILKEWQDMRPLEYLASEAIKKEWQVNMVELASQLPRKNNPFLSAPARKRVLSLFHGIDTLEACLESFEKTFCMGNDKHSSCTWIRNPVQKDVNERLQIINFALSKREVNQY